MKLRIRGNSIRLRLGEREVAQLVESGRVAERLQFSVSPGESLTYAIVSSAEAKEIAASFAENEIRVIVPAAAAKEWASSTQVGMDRVQPIDAGRRAEHPDREGFPLPRAARRRGSVR